MQTNDHFIIQIAQRAQNLRDLVDSLCPSDQSSLCARLAELVDHFQSRVIQQDGCLPKLHLKLVLSPPAPTVWYKDQSCGFQVHLLDEFDCPFPLPTASVMFRLRNKNGGEADDKLCLRPTLRSRRFVDGIFETFKNEVTIKSVSSKLGGSVTLEAYLTIPVENTNDANASDVSGAPILSVEPAKLSLVVKSKPTKQRVYEPDMPVCEMEQMGAMTSRRLENILQVRTIRDLAQLPLKHENPNRFQTLLDSIRQPRSRITDVVLCKCIAQARTCVQNSGEILSIDSLTSLNDIDAVKFGEVTMSPTPMTMAHYSGGAIQGGNDDDATRMFSPSSSSPISSSESSTPVSGDSMSVGARTKCSVESLGQFEMERECDEYFK